MGQEARIESEGKGVCVHIYVRALMRGRCADERSMGTGGGMRGVTALPRVCAYTCARIHQRKMCESKECGMGGGMLGGRALPLRMLALTIFRL